MKKLNIKHVVLSIALGLGVSYLVSLPGIKHVQHQVREKVRPEFSGLYQSLTQALSAADIATLEQLLTEDFELHTIRGAKFSKQVWLGHIQNGTMRYLENTMTRAEPANKNSGIGSMIVAGEMFNELGVSP